MNEIATVASASEGYRSGTPRAGKDNRPRGFLCGSDSSTRLPDPDHDCERAAPVAHRRSLAQIPVCRCGLERQGSNGLSGRSGRPYRGGLLAVHPGEIQPVRSTASIRAGAVAGQSDLFLAGILLLLLLHSKAPGQGNKCRDVFLAFPAAAFFLLHGGGVDGFAVSWTGNRCRRFASSVAEAGRPCCVLVPPWEKKTQSVELLLQSVGWRCRLAGPYDLIVLDLGAGSIAASGYAGRIDLPSEAGSLVLLLWLNGERAPAGVSDR